MRRNLISMSVNTLMCNLLPPNEEPPQLQQLLAPWQHQQHLDPTVRRQSPTVRLQSRVTLTPPPERPQINARKATMAQLLQTPRKPLAAPRLPTGMVDGVEWVTYPPYPPGP